MKNTNFFIAIVILILCSSCRTEIKKKPGNDWHDRFSDIARFNQFSRQNNGNVTFKRLIARNYKLNGIRAKDLIIDNCLLENLDLKNSTINRLIVKNSDLKNLDFHGKTVINHLIINDSKLTKFICRACTTQSTQIVNTTVSDGHLVLLQGKNMLIKDSKVTDGSVFSGSEIKQIKIENTKFDTKDTNYISHITSDYLHITDSIPNTSFYESRIRKVVLENIRGGYAGFSRLEGESITVKDSRLDWLKLFVIARPLKYFESTNSSYATRLAIGGNQTIGNITIKDCPDVSNVSFGNAVVDTIAVSHCNFNLFKFWESRIKEISVQHAKINSFGYLAGRWRDFHFENFSFTDVYLDGTFEMENARIDNFRVTDLKRGKNFRVSENGVNFTLNPDDDP